MNRRTSSSVVVVGDDPVAAVVADSLPGDVLFVTPDERTARRVEADVADTAVVADLADYRPPAGTDTAIVATGSDGTNLLIARQFRLADIDVVTRLNDRANSRAFEDVDAGLVCASTRVGESLAEHYTKQVAPHQ